MVTGGGAWSPVEGIRGMVTGGHGRHRGLLSSCIIIDVIKNRRVNEVYRPIYVFCRYCRVGRFPQVPSPYLTRKERR